MASVAPCTSTLTRADLVRLSTSIAGEYEGKVSVRQIYYQFVSRGLFAPQHKDDSKLFYERLGTAMGVARMQGVMPFDWVRDSMRDAQALDCLKNDVDPDEALDNATDWIRSMPRWAINRSRWWGQKTHVTIGVEKETLAWVFEDMCEELGVGLFVFRGYSSLSSLWQWAKGVEEAEADSADGYDEAVLLYFGDHDPDGWEIPRSAIRNIEEIAEVDGLDLPPIRLERAGLNMEQIERYDPPPFGAKVTSSRYRAYVDEHGTDDAWELDSLDPGIMRDETARAVARYFDRKVDKANRRVVSDARAIVSDTMRSPGWLDRVFDGE